MSPTQETKFVKYSKNHRTISMMAIFFICRNNLADLKKEKNIKRINIEAEGREEETQTEEAEETRK